MGKDPRRLTIASSHEFGFGIPLPDRTDFGIAVVGAGAIINTAHLPAYAAQGFNVVGVTDIRSDRAEATARRFDIKRVYADLTELLADPEVDIVDVAVSPQAQAEIAFRAAAAGKHLLCQKPLSDSLATATEIVERADSAGVKLAVNLQMRWTPIVQCANSLLRRGSLGQPTYAAIRAHMLTDWTEWPWILEGERGDLLFHSIHYFDTLRYLFGSPASIFSVGSTEPNSAMRGETQTLTVMAYPSGLHVLVDVSHGVWSDDRFATVRIEGTAGLMKGTIGLEYDPPVGRVDTIQLRSERDYPEWTDPQPRTRWLPDAFAGPMASLMAAIAEDSAPATSGRDHLETLRLVFSAYRSIEERRNIDPYEVGRSPARAQR
jgi:predicted dehydrogenase